MIAEPIEQKVRVWFHPAKLWAATERMPPTEVEALMEHLQWLAEKNDVVALRKYDFIRVGEYRDVQWS